MTHKVIRAFSFPALLAITLAVLFLFLAEQAWPAAQKLRPSAPGQLQVTPQNHYKTWRVQPLPFTGAAQVKDQFMIDELSFSQIEFLSNPVRKVVGIDTSNIIEPDNHLSWYRAQGRDTLIGVEYVNQFESTAVLIDSVKYLLVPTQKLPHNPPVGLDHYKAYRIKNPSTLVTPVELLDQFDPVTNPELIDSLVPVYFCTPAMKNTEPIHDTLTHYVAYLIQPKRTSSEIRSTVDQFGVHSMTILNSEMLLVPTKKRIPPPPPPDTGKNHYKTWKIQPLPLPTTPSAKVKDQFMVDTLALPQIEFLSNPTTKIVGTDTFNVTKPNNHLSWYKAQGRDTLLEVEYANQFESTTVLIDSVKYLLLPAQKSPHGPYDSLDHYKAYRIKDPQLFNRGVQLQDQFDATPQPVTSLLPAYFLTPAQKNTEPIFDTLTHYVAYSIDPKIFTSLIRTLTDQFGLYEVEAVNSEMLLVPTKKIAFSAPPECSDGLDNDGDGLVDFPADCGCADPTDNSEAPNPVTQCSNGIDDDGDGLIDLADCGCTDVCDNAEAPNPARACNDGIDNDLDGFIDLADPGCGDVCDNDESNPWPDTGQNHYKVWRTAPVPFTLAVRVKDQFTTDTLSLVSLEFLANPVWKDSFLIVDPNYHLNWYRAVSNRNPKREVIFENQFESTLVTIDTVKYLLVPAQKQPLPAPDSLDHYKCYRIQNPNKLIRRVLLEDQFDALLNKVETIDSLTRAYFCSPCMKNNGPTYDTLTHYVVYSFIPDPEAVPTQVTVDQFGNHPMQVLQSEMLMVPTEKLCIAKPGDANASNTITLGDVIAIVNYIFNKPGWPPCPSASSMCWLSDLLCRGNANGDATVTLADVIYLVNYIFNKPGGPWTPLPSGVCCLPVP